MVKLRPLLKCIKRTAEQHEDQWLALLEIRNTPQQDILASPAQIMFGRPIRTIVPAFTKKCDSFDFDRRYKRRNVVKTSHYKCTPIRSLAPLQLNQNVYFQSPEKEGWRSDTIVEKLSLRSYVIEAANGIRYRRNRVYIRPNLWPHSQSIDFDVYDYVS